MQLSLCALSQQCSTQAAMYICICIHIKSCMYMYRFFFNVSVVSELHVKYVLKLCQNAAVFQYEILGFIKICSPWCDMHIYARASVTVTLILQYGYDSDGI